MYGLSGGPATASGLQLGEYLPRLQNYKTHLVVRQMRRELTAPFVHFPHHRARSYWTRLTTDNPRVVMRNDKEQQVRRDRATWKAWATGLSEQNNSDVALRKHKQKTPPNFYFLNNYGKCFNKNLRTSPPMANSGVAN